MGLATACYEAAELYESARAKLREVYWADPHMTDRNGDSTKADKDWMSLREIFIDLLKTTISRYVLVGEQLEEAARAYVEVDEEQADDLEAIEDSMERMGVEPPDLGWDPSVEADATEETGAENSEELPYDPAPTDLGPTETGKESA